MELLVDQPPEAARENAAAHALAGKDGVQLARDLVTAPANQATPNYLVETARSLARSVMASPWRSLTSKQPKQLGMGAFLAVAQGSREPAYLIVMEYAPAGKEQDRPLVFVGKGITFDSGGISIKPSARMELMKHDMAGAAAVLGAFAAWASWPRPPAWSGLIPCRENMPDGKAYKPGDVIRSLAGLTIEVISTDAEGRMILCDALAYAQRYSPRPSSIWRRSPGPASLLWETRSARSWETGKRSCRRSRTPLCPWAKGCGRCRLGLLWMNSKATWRI